MRRSSTVHLSIKHLTNLLEAHSSISQMKYVNVKQNKLFVKAPKKDECSIGILSGTNCGSVTVKGNVITEYRALSYCQRDITGYLKMLKMRGDDVLSEKELILLRAGKDIFVALSSQFFPVVCNLFIASFLYILAVFEGTPDINVRVCPKHRDSFGIKWRGPRGCHISPLKKAHR